jgi:XTP/dITP diphosphohydrolase
MPARGGPAPLKLYCATGNPGKLRDFSLAAGLEWEFVPLIGIPPCPETGATFERNAVEKAVYYSRHAPGLLFAEDSGLEVDSLGGAPGVLSARFAGAGSADRDNNRLLIEKLRGVNDRSARFVCVMALAKGGRALATFRGQVDGRIIDQPRGTGGFGYDPHFYYEPFGFTFAEASPQRKLEVSHRGRALRKMLEWLQLQNRYHFLTGTGGS